MWDTLYGQEIPVVSLLRETSTVVSIIEMKLLFLEDLDLEQPISLPIPVKSMMMDKERIEPGFSGRIELKFMVHGPWCFDPLKVWSMI